MEFNKRGFECFKKDVDVALKEVAEKHGVSIDCGSITYSQFDFTMQLKVSKNDGNTDGKRMLFERDCVFYGFKKEDYEREFTSNGKRFKLVGFNTRSPKNCCSIYCITDGKQYKCSAEMVQRALGR